MSQSWFESKIHMTGLSDNLIRLNPTLMIQQGGLAGMLSVQLALPSTLPPNDAFGRKIGIQSGGVGPENFNKVKIVGLRAIYKQSGDVADPANYDFCLWEEIVPVLASPTISYTANQDYMRFIAAYPLISNITNQQLSDQALLIRLADIGPGGTPSVMQANYSSFDNPTFSVPDGHVFHLNDITINTSRSIEIMVFKKPIFASAANPAEWKCIFRNTQNNGSFLSNSTHSIRETVYAREEVIVLCRTFAVAVGYGSVSLSGELVIA